MEQSSLRNQFELLRELLESGGIPEFYPRQIIKEISAMCADYAEAEKYLYNLMLSQIKSNSQLCFTIFLNLSQIVNPTNIMVETIKMFEKHFKTRK